MMYNVIKSVMGAGWKFVHKTVVHTLVTARPHKIDYY